MRFLINECLSPALVPAAIQAGYAAMHVAHIGKASRKDWSLFDYVLAEDMILVTNNAGYFRKFYASEPCMPASSSSSRMSIVAGSAACSKAHGLKWIRLGYRKGSPTIKAIQTFARVSNRPHVRAAGLASATP